MSEQLYKRIVRTDGHEGHWFDFEPVQERTCKAIPTMDEMYIRMPSTCSLCGNRMADHDKFCATCGAKVVRE